MSMSLKIVIGLVLVVMLGAVVGPPVFEDHLEAGFCSADCPVQHTGHGVALTTPPLAGADGRAPVVAAAETRTAAAELGLALAPDAPRAPPTT